MIEVGAMLRIIPHFWQSLICCSAFFTGLLLLCIVFIQTNYNIHRNIELPSPELSALDVTTKEVKVNNSLKSISESRVCDNRNSSTINKTRHELSKAIKKLKSRTPGPATLDANLNFLGELSESQISNVVDAFGVSNLNSSILNRQFLACPGLYLIKRAVNFDGKIDVPKHFQNCKMMSFQRSGITAALLSFPGSGNSWVRQLLETTTGIYTGAYKDCDLSYINAGMIGEGVYTNNVIAVKIHFPYHADLMLTHKIIYIIRNPFDAILAEWNRRQSVMRDRLTAHVSTAKKEYFGGINMAKWDKAVKEYAVSWKDHVQTWMKSKRVPMLVIKYENLLNNLYGELKRMMEFLEFSYTGDDLQCTINSASTESFHRKHDTSLNPYTPEQKQWILAQIKLANKVLLPYNITY